MRDPACPSTTASFALPTADLAAIAERILAFLTPSAEGCAYSLSQDGRGYDYIHCEVSGYALSFFLRLEGEGIAQYKPAAEGLAAFLLQTQKPSGAFPHSVRAGEGLPLRDCEVYSFDTAVCASALLDYAAARGCSQSAAAVQRALDWLTEKAQRTDGSFRCVYNGRVGDWDCAARSSFWSSEGGCYLGKILIPLLKGRRYEPANRLVGYLLAARRADSAWNATPRHTQSHTHAMLYALEGLAFYSFTQRQTVVQNAVAGAMQWLSGLALRNGGLPAWESEPQTSFRSDVQLQYLRLADLLGPEIAPPEAREACALRLLTLRTADGFWRFDTGPNGRSARLPSWPLVFEGCLHLQGSPKTERIV